MLRGSLPELSLCLSARIVCAYTRNTYCACNFHILHVTPDVKIHPRNQENPSNVTRPSSRLRGVGSGAETSSRDYHCAWFKGHARYNVCAREYTVRRQKARDRGYIHDRNLRRRSVCASTRPPGRPASNKNGVVMNFTIYRRDTEAPSSKLKKAGYMAFD